MRIEIEAEVWEQMTEEQRMSSRGVKLEAAPVMEYPDGPEGEPVPTGMVAVAHPDLTSVDDLLIEAVKLGQRRGEAPELVYHKGEAIAARLSDKFLDPDTLKKDRAPRRERPKRVPALDELPFEKGNTDVRE